MITNLFHPSGDNVNDNIDQQFCSINFFSFDGVINITHTKDKGSLLQNWLFLLVLLDVYQKVL